MNRLIERASWAVVAALAAGTVSCASSPAPRELVDARAAYAEAQAGGAAENAPVQLYEARRSLDRAERAFVDHPRANTTVDLAYVAERRAEIAEAAARTRTQMRRGAIANAERERALTTGRSRALAERDQMRNALENESDALGRERVARQNAEVARQAAEARAREAMSSLQQVAFVHEETRGTVITLSGSVLFPTGQSTLLASAQQRLDEVAAALLTTDEQRSIVVEGHTDSVGTDASNEALSYRRAAAVRDYLVMRSVPTTRLSVIGYGETRPVAENSTVDGRASNRRVEIVLTPAPVVTTTTVVPVPTTTETNTLIIRP